MLALQSGYVKDKKAGICESCAEGSRKKLCPQRKSQKLVQDSSRETHGQVGLMSGVEKRKALFRSQQRNQGQDHVEAVEQEMNEHHRHIAAAAEVGVSECESQRDQGD